MSVLTGQIATAAEMPANANTTPLRARIQWLRWRELPLQAKRNWITTSLYLMRCESVRNAKSPGC